MSVPDQDPRRESARNGQSLLEWIQAVRVGVGDGLNDAELTHLLREIVLPPEGCFRFLTYSEGFVTLVVPDQDPESWYPRQGWITEEKERLARGVAEKRGLRVCRPPDAIAGYRAPGDETRHVHHHLEFTNEVETLVVAHPWYLKVRLFGSYPGARYTGGSRNPLLHDPELLRDLSALYEP